MCVTHLAESAARFNGPHTAAQEWPSAAFRLESSREHVFVQMLRAYRRTGGIEREGDLFRRMQRLTAAVAGTYNGKQRQIRFEWSGCAWLPLFQFEPNSLSLRPESQRVVAELAPYFDGWRLALWFAEPNLWLADRSPVDLLETNPTYVFDAARADRFVAAG